METKPLSEAMKEFKDKETKSKSMEEAIKGNFSDLANSSNLGDAFKKLNMLKKKNPDMPEKDFSKTSIAGLGTNWDAKKVYKQWVDANLDKILKKQEKEQKIKLDAVRLGMDTLLKANGFENYKLKKSEVKVTKKGLVGKLEIEL